MKTDREICAAATDGPWKIDIDSLVSGRVEIDSPSFDTTVCETWTEVGGLGDAEFIANFNPQKVLRMLDRQEELEAKLKEASEFIQKLGPTIDYDIVAEIEEMLGE